MSYIVDVAGLITRPRSISANMKLDTLVYNVAISIIAPLWEWKAKTPVTNEHFLSLCLNAWQPNAADEHVLLKKAGLSAN